jgi:penicillin-binding protein 1A
MAPCKYDGPVRQLILNLKYRRIDHNTGIAPYYRDQLKIQVESILQEEYCDTINLLTDGLRIYTSIDSRLQSYAEQSMQKHMRRLQKEFNAHWKNRTPWTNNSSLFENAVKNSKRYKSLEAQGLEKREIFAELKKKTSTLPGQSEITNKISPLDSVRQELLTLHTGFLAIDPSNGHILAWIGGIDHKYFQYDHVKAKRQVGSTFKPIVYAAALESGMEPCDFLPNERKIYKDYDDWSPANDDNTYEGFYSLKGGLAHSVNTIAANVIMKTGIRRVIRLAENLGIQSNIPVVPSIALGTVEISMLEMLEAYSAFLRYGNPVKPYGLLRIEDRNGNILYEYKPSEEKRKALSKETSLEMIYMLKEVVDSGTAHSLRTIFQLNGDLAGKTGTTQDNADGWFIGFTPNILAGCWVGAESPTVHFRTTTLGQGAYMALPIFAGFIGKTSADRNLRRYTAGRFPLLPVDLKHMLDCPDYSLDNPELSFFERLFGTKPKTDSLQLIQKEERIQKRQEQKQKAKEKSRNFMNKVRKFFGKKKK